VRFIYHVNQGGGGKEAVKAESLKEDSASFEAPRVVETEFGLAFTAGFNCAQPTSAIYLSR
jgi:hypothetical protein